MSAERHATVDELLAAYADDPASLSAGERAAVESRLAADPAAAREVDELRALLGQVRGQGDVAAGGTDWDALAAGIRASVTPERGPTRRRTWLAGAGVVLAAAAALAVWWQRRAGDGPGLEVARLTAIAMAPVRAGAPSIDRAVDPSIDRAVDPSIDPLDPAGDPVANAARALAPLDLELAEELALDEADDLDDLTAGGDDGDLLDEEVLIGRALERVPAPVEDDGVFPGLDTDWVEDLSEREVEEALRWLDSQGAG